MDSDMRQRARTAMKIILEAARFEVEEVDDPLDLSAVRDADCLLVLCSNDPEAIAQFDGTNYNLMVDDQEMSCRKLIFTLEEGIVVGNSILWGVKEFVRFAGEAVLADMLQRELAFDLSQMKSAGAPAARGAKGKSEEVMETEEPEEAESAGAEGDGMSIPHLPVKVDVQRAMRTAGVQGTAKLRFIPYWLFHYTSSGEQVYKDRRIPFDSDGWGGINAVNGMRIELDGSDVETKEIPGSSEIVDLHISKDEVKEKITAELIEKLTQRVRIKQEKGDAIFYEEKVLKPDRKNINIDFQQVFIPVWQIRGKKIAEINAYTGELLTEPMDEGVEVF
ncbi:MAG: hypothetical protein ABFC24_12830 [Methanoregulaceae archaeon]